MSDDETIRSRSRRTILRTIGVALGTLAGVAGTSGAHPHGDDHDRDRDQDRDEHRDWRDRGHGRGHWKHDRDDGHRRGRGYHRRRGHRHDRTRWDDWTPGDGKPPWADDDDDEDDDDHDHDHGEDDDDEEEPDPDEPEEPDDPEPDPDDPDEPDEPEDPDDDDDDAGDGDGDDGDEDEPEEPDPDPDPDPDEPEPDPEPDTVAGQIEQRIHAETNAYRESQGLGPLTFDDDLAAVAREHSEDMNERDYFDHDSPEGDDAGDRLDDAGVDCRGWGENIAYEYDSSFSEDDANSVADSIVEGWLSSSGHRRNIVGDYDAEGVGVAIDGGTVMATQLFCSE